MTLFISKNNTNDPNLDPVFTWNQIIQTWENIGSWFTSKKYILSTNLRSILFMYD